MDIKDILKINDLNQISNVDDLSDSPLQGIAEQNQLVNIYENFISKYPRSQGNECASFCFGFEYGYMFAKKHVNSLK